MSNNYYCPHCRSNMNIGTSLVLSAKSRVNVKGILFLDTKLGNYKKTSHSEFKLVDGEEYTFYCPVCHGRLNKEETPHLVKLYMTDDQGKECEINISNIIGEHCTYKIQDREVRAYGPHANRYRQYLDVPEEYRKYL